MTNQFVDNFVQHFIELDCCCLAIVELLMLKYFNNNSFKSPIAHNLKLEIKEICTHTHTYIYMERERERQSNCFLKKITIK